MKKFLASLIGAIVLMTGVAACGNQPVNYTPAAAAFGGNGQCYMPLSVPQTYWQQIEQQYVHQGWCHAGWTPVYIPMSTYETYYPYYSSGSFYNTYIPLGYRTSYVSYEHQFGTTYRSQISTLSKTATYKGTNGKTTTYNQIKTGGGTRGSFGTGTRCDVVRDSLMKPQYVHRGGGGGFGGGSRGGSSGGGSRGSSGGGSRSGTSGGSRTGSGSRSGC